MRSLARPHRASLMAAVFTLVLVAYTARLYDLQIEHFHRYAASSQGNLLRQEREPALRGELRARDGTLLATHRLRYDLIYHGGAVSGWERIRYLARLEERPLPPGETGGEVVLARDLLPERARALSELLVGQSALELRSRTVRVYPQGALAGNLLGYTAEANAAEVQRGLERGTRVGRAGLEAGLDRFLRGQDGLRVWEVDAAGRVIRPLEGISARAGASVTLTLDPLLQRAAERALEEGLESVNRHRRLHRLRPYPTARAAAVAVDPRSGEVLALATSPHLNPNDFSRHPRPPALVAALTGQSGALLDRSLQPFAPGSVFKIASTLAHLEAFGNRSYGCPPYLEVGGRRFHNWNRTRDMGAMDARAAIAWSCDTWYYDAALQNGPKRYADAIAAWARRLGYGMPTGLELPSEAAGLVPSAREYEARGTPWYPGNTLNYAIGQGDLLATPAQVARALAAVVTRGELRPLTLLRAVDGQAVPRRAPMRIRAKPSSWETLLEGMEGTVRYGTAKHLLGPGNFAVPTGGKTGTAETGRGWGAWHAWYAGYGPVGAPDLVVVTFFEQGGEGSAVALEAARKIMAARWQAELAP
ncbi:penicillin-binding protein 2 [Deinobacterium chartae]|uniref:Penicillin-binding protein 2 n=1 Tax=Deinobacterium chartae TaxID=521158 RepID=A0A841I2Z2_9DEIO|nr:penicillin-binding transpeptidase domain-containing protein [Deinobacterium chartae]MBB6098780.1 penicillin-binding protein 2 [Deinobacterium chartae]